MFSFVKRLIRPAAAPDFGNLTPEEKQFALQFDEVRLAAPVEGEVALPGEMIAFIGRNLETARTEMNVYGAWRMKSKRKPFRGVSCYTTQYEEHAQRLQATLDCQLVLPHRAGRDYGDMGGQLRI